MNLNFINNLVELFQIQEKNYKNQDFLFSINKDNSFDKFSWNDVNKKINSLSRFIKDNGIKKGDRVMLVSEDRPEWLISDLSILAIGAITVPNYTTYTKKDFEFIIKDCEPKGLIVSNKKLLDTILAASDLISHKFNFIICFDDIDHELTKSFSVIKDDKLEDVICTSDRKDPACIIYTSGTQGNPKGVVLSHGGILANCEDAKNLVEEINIKKLKFLTWLPLSHSYEHTVQFVQISLGAEIYYCSSVDKLLENIKVAKPHILTAVPRFYNNLFNRMQVNANKASKFKKTLFYKTIELGKKIFLGKKLSFLESVQNSILDFLVRKKVLQNFGGNLKAFISGGGPLDQNVGLFLNALGLKTLQGYGLTEASPVVSCNPVNNIRIETVGKIFKNNQVQIAEDGEILVKGENIMLGYWNNSDATNEILKNGWLYTGDIGELDNDGYLKITDRKKDIIVTIGGDNVSPSKIENLLCLSDKIEQAYVHGDNEKFLSCLIVPNQKEKVLEEEVQNIIDQVNLDLTVTEKIKKFRLIDEEFTIENELLTPTLKIRRHKIKIKYKNILENFYKN